MTIKNATIAVALSVVALTLPGCAGYTSPGANMNGFPLDPACAAFYGNDPFYKGNFALAYGTNCVGGVF